MIAHEGSRALIRAHERSWVLMMAHEHSWGPMCTYEDPWALMRAHECSWALMGAYEQLMSGSWATHELIFCISEANELFMSCLCSTFSLLLSLMLLSNKVPHGKRYFFAVLFLKWYFFSCGTIQRYIFWWYFFKRYFLIKYHMVSGTFPCGTFFLAVLFSGTFLGGTFNFDHFWRYFSKKYLVLI